MARKKSGGSRVVVRGFLRVQSSDPKTGKVIADSGWVQNKLTNAGLTQLALLLASGTSSGYCVGYAALGTQNTAVDMSQTDLVGRTNSFRAVTLSTSGTCTLTATASFSSSDLGGACNVAAAGLYKTNTAGSLIACQTFATSAWATNQDFNLTYQIRFATA